MKLGKMRFLVVAAAFTLAFALAGCASQSTQSSSEGPDYADDEAMAAIAKGLEARWAITDAAAYEGTAESLKAAVNAELETDLPLKDRQFEDSKMQEAVLKYINTLEDSIAVIERYPFESLEYDEKWEAVYDDRTAQLKDLVETYGLSVSAANQASLDELLTNGAAVKSKSERDDAIRQIFEKVEFDKVDDGYGYYTYTAIVENTTDFDYENVDILLALYDADDVRADEVSAYVQSWEKGEKAKFEASSDVDAAKVKVSVDSYQAEG